MRAHLCSKIKGRIEQAQKGNSRVRREMTNKRAKTCWNVKNVKNVKEY